MIYAGAGLKHFVDIFVKTLLSHASIVLIDEPEMGLHPGLQRELLLYMDELARDRGIQFFLATHSPVFLADPGKVTAFCVQNRQGRRTVFEVPRDTIHTLWSDLGLRPGDLLQNDMVVLVEGQKDVIFFEQVIHRLYRDDFRDIAIAVIQYGGDAANGIIDGTISVSNVVPGLSRRLWIRDRDASPGENPSASTVRFCEALQRQGEKCYILCKREIEYYIPEAVYVAVQGGHPGREAAVREILRGDQAQKFATAACEPGCSVPRGYKLRELLEQHLSRDSLDGEIRDLVEGTLFPWRDEILGRSAA